MRGFPQARGAGSYPELGLERVNWVRVVHGPAGARCHVAGIAHRRPVLRRVPLRTASALLAAGVPGVVRSAPAGAEAPAPRRPERRPAGDRG